MLEPAKYTTGGRGSSNFFMNGVPYSRFKKDNDRWNAGVAHLLGLLRGHSAHAGTPVGTLQTLNITLPTNYAVQCEEFDQMVYMDVMEMTCRRMDSILAATLVNPTPTITSLAIRNLPMYTSSAMKTLRWRAFLKRLTHFELSLFGTQPELFTTNADESFPEFVASLTTNIFQHLSSVESLKVEGAEKAIVGHHLDEHAAPLNLGRGTMPKLKNLELVTTVIDRPFIEFLENRPRDSQPLNLTLTNTMSYNYDDYEDFDAPPVASCLEWCETFDKITNLMDTEGFPGISGFTASFLDVTKHPFIEEGISPAEQRQMDDLSRLAGSDRSRIMFAYMSLSEKFGYLIGDMWKTRKGYETGKDQLAYDKLLARIAQRNEKLSESRGGRPGRA